MFLTVFSRTNATWRWLGQLSHLAVQYDFVQASRSHYFFEIVSRSDYFLYFSVAHIIYMKASGEPAMAIDWQDNTEPGTSKLLLLQLIWRARMPIYTGYSYSNSLVIVYSAERRWRFLRSEGIQSHPLIFDGRTSFLEEMSGLGADLQLFVTLIIT